MLVFAPLVEFRYFVIPWVMWRVHIGLDKSWSWKIGGVDWRVWCEMLLFLGVHVVTTNIFLVNTFQWENENEWQRFMW